MNHKAISARIVNPLLGTTIPLPSYATDGSGAMDLRACVSEPLVIPPGTHKLIGTGLAVDIKDPGIAALVTSRSGFFLKQSARVGQGIGLIDSDYQGEIGVILENNGSTPLEVNPGDRIAQLMFVPLFQVKLDYVDSFSSQTERGAGGFGSTGKN